MKEPKFKSTFSKKDVSFRISRDRSAYYIIVDHVTKRAFKVRIGNCGNETSNPKEISYNSPLLSTKHSTNLTAVDKESALMQIALKLLTFDITVIDNFAKKVYIYKAPVWTRLKSGNLNKKAILNFIRRASGADIPYNYNEVAMRYTFLTGFSGVKL